MQLNDQPKEAVVPTTTIGFQPSVSQCLSSLKGTEVFFVVVGGFFLSCSLIWIEIILSFFLFPSVLLPIFISQSSTVHERERAQSQE